MEQVFWVAVSTYSAAMATSSMAIDNAAKWVRVCECDNLVKITFKPNILHTHTLSVSPAVKKRHLLARAVTIRLSVASNSSERKSLLKDDALIFPFSRWSKLGKHVWCHFKALVVQWNDESARNSAYFQETVGWLANCWRDNESISVIKSCFHNATAFVCHNLP